MPFCTPLPDCGFHRRVCKCPDAPAVAERHNARLASSRPRVQLHTLTSPPRPRYRTHGVIYLVKNTLPLQSFICSFASNNTAGASQAKEWMNEDSSSERAGGIAETNGLIGGPFAVIESDPGACSFSHLFPNDLGTDRGLHNATPEARRERARGHGDLRHRTMGNGPPEAPRAHILLHV